MIGVIFVVLRFLYWLWQRTRSGQNVRRGLIIATGVAFFAFPYISFKIYERAAVLARVPEPLKVAAIEYRLEQSWGIGGPGDNETGFVVYRLTDSSVEWARSCGAQLGSMLAGDSETVWQATPIAEDHDRKTWHHYDDDPFMRVDRPKGHLATIAELLEAYGHTIDIEKGRDAEADQAIQTEGSFYSYGRGGSVTIVDPKRGKVYFAYVG